GCFPVVRRPSRLCRAVGVHHDTFGACSGFTRVTARGFAREPFAPFCPEASSPRIAPLRSSVAMELYRQFLQRNSRPLDTSAFRGALQIVLTDRAQHHLAAVQPDADRERYTLLDSQPIGVPLDVLLHA